MPTRTGKCILARDINIDKDYINQVCNKKVEYVYLYSTFNMVKKFQYMY